MPPQRAPRSRKHRGRAWLGSRQLDHHSGCGACSKMVVGCAARTWMRSSAWRHLRPVDDEGEHVSGAAAPAAAAAARNVPTQRAAGGRQARQAQASQTRTNRTSRGWEARGMRVLKRVQTRQGVGLAVQTQGRLARRWGSHTCPLAEIGDFPRVRVLHTSTMVAPAMPRTARSPSVFDCSGRKVCL